jgi:hypothetical protein
MVAPTPSKLDIRQIFQSVHDESNGTLRTTSQATIANADIAVAIDAATGDNIAIKGATGNELVVNADGSINVVTGNAVAGVTKSFYNEISNVVNGITTSIVTYTVPTGKTAVLERVFVTGDNIARYEIFINATKIDSTLTYFGSALNSSFDFSSGYSGLGLATNDIVTVTVVHSRTSLGNFSGRIQISEI